MVVRELLKHAGLDVNVKDDNGCTALAGACENGPVDVVWELLKVDTVDVNIRNDDGRTPLILASANGHSNVVRQLLKHQKIDVNAKDNDGTTALLVACEKGNVDVVRELLNHELVDGNAQSDAGNSAIILAIDNGHLMVVRELLKRGGRTVLESASYKGHSEVVCELNAKGLLHDEYGEEHSIGVSITSDQRIVKRVAEGCLLDLHIVRDNAHVEVMSHPANHCHAVANGDVNEDEGSTGVSIASDNSDYAETLSWDHVGSDYMDVHHGIEGCH